MSMIECLEGRKLFAAVSPQLASAYANLAADNATIRSVGKSLQAAIRADIARVAADVKKLEAGRSSAALVAQVKSSGTKVLAVATSAVSHYLATSTPAAAHFKAAAAATAAKPTAGHLRALAAAQQKLSAAGPGQLSDVGTVVTNASATLGTLIAQLAADNPTATALNADLSTADGDRVSMFGNLTIQLDTAVTDADALLNASGIA